MDAYKTPGAVSWAELMTTDPSAAQKLSIRSCLAGARRDMAMTNGNYTTCQVGETSVAGIDVDS